MISINPQKMSVLTFKKSYLPKPKVSNPQKKSDALSKSLLGLALLGLATVSSCSKDDYLGEMFETQTNSEHVASTKQTINNVEERRTAYGTTTEIFRLLGILKEENDSLQKIETVSCKDNENIRHYIKPIVIYDNYIAGKGMTVLPDDSAGEIYNFVIKNTDNNSINFIKTYDNGKKEIKNYEVSKNNTIVEYDVYDGNYMLEKSVYRKLADDSIEQTFTDGSTKIYSNISREYPYPVPITFGAEVDDYSNTDVNVNM